MDKFESLRKKEEHQELIFKETMSLRNAILKKKGEIAHLEKEVKDYSKDVNRLEAQTFQLATEIKMLEAQNDDIFKDIENSLKKALKKEQQVEVMKASLTDTFRYNIEKAKEIQNKLHLKTEENNKSDVQRDEILERKIALQGEIEAMQIIGNYQTMKIREINKIKNVIKSFPPLVE